METISGTTVTRGGVAAKYIKRTILVISVFAIAAVSVRCSMPRRLWSGRDIVATELHDPTEGKRVLVASLSTEFKDAVVARIMELFKDDPVYIKFIGLGALENEDADLYSAVVVINRCVAWGMSPKAQSFVDRYHDRDHIVVLTTSGDGEWAPDRSDASYDAITTASVKTDVNIVADKISARIRTLIAG